MTNRPVYRPALLLAAILTALSLTLSSCSSSPQDMTIHGTLTLTSLNGVPPAQAFPEAEGNISPPPPGPDGITYDPPLQVTITADDGPGNYSGQPWNEVTTDMTLKSATAKVIVFTFTARVPDDADMYQIDALCCDQTMQDGSYTLEEMQQGPAVCAGDACPA